jgi:hypothetical protein
MQTHLSKSTDCKGSACNENPANEGPVQILACMLDSHVCTEKEDPYRVYGDMVSLHQKAQLKKTFFAPQVKRSLKRPWRRNSIRPGRAGTRKTLQIRVKYVYESHYKI